MRPRFRRPDRPSRPEPVAQSRSLRHGTSAHRRGSTASCGEVRSDTDSTDRGQAGARIDDAAAQRLHAESVAADPRRDRLIGVQPAVLRSPASTRGRERSPSLIPGTGFRRDAGREVRRNACVDAASPNNGPIRQVRGVAPPSSCRFHRKPAIAPGLRLGRMAALSPRKADSVSRRYRPEREHLPLPPSQESGRHIDQLLRTRRPTAAPSISRTPSSSCIGAPPTGTARGSAIASGAVA